MAKGFRVVRKGVREWVEVEITAAAYDSTTVLRYMDENGWQKIRESAFNPKSRRMELVLERYKSGDRNWRRRK